MELTENLLYGVGVGTWLVENHSASGGLWIPPDTTLLLPCLIDCIRESKRQAIQQRFDIQTVGEGDSCNYDLASRILLHKSQNFLIVFE
jgi:hypothetical protein